ncbi:MAG: prepilin-type N-terminal cleavage/methylation domain-containing protein [Sphingobacteriia bacterium]|nr:prepilin-type N-terminal cleavage/methylation domain-containing protein [Sphingobacteriia bacterium]
MSYIYNKSKAFTLVELSIVLVIIGLIVGGILTGQSLIRTAELSATIRQVSNFNTAVSAFRIKYNGIPGDLPSSIATSFGLATRDGTTGKGDGNGLIEGGAAASTNADGETALFWNDLWAANLIEGNTSSYTTAASAVTTSATATLENFFPPAKVGKGAFFIVYSINGVNYYELIGLSSVAGGTYTTFNSLAPSDAYYIDGKLDDGMPGSGIVLASPAGSPAGAASSGAGGAAANVCVNTTPNPDVYNNQNPALLCRVVIRMN